MNVSGLMIGNEVRGKIEKGAYAPSTFYLATQFVILSFHLLRLPLCVLQWHLVWLIGLLQAISVDKRKLADLITDSLFALRKVGT